MEGPTPEQAQSVLFLNLVISFQTAALQQMGKLKNPFTDKIERDLSQARMSIDIIEMIKTKTQGNLSREESDFISRTLRELQLNYIDELEKDKKAAPASESKTDEKTEG